MAQDYSSSLMYPMAENFSTDKFQLTIEKFDGTVHDIMQKKEILDGVFTHSPLVGTDTMSNAALGDPTLSKVEAGVEPAIGNIEAGKMIVQVKQPIIARVTTPMLADVQTHIDVRGKTPAKFGKRIAKHLDELKFVQVVKSGLYADTTNTDKGSAGILPQAVAEALAAAGDEVDPSKLTAGIYAIAQGLAELDIDLEEGRLYMAPAQYFALLKNRDLLDGDINKPNGSYAQAKIDAASGMPIVMTNRITQVEDTVAFPAFSDSTAALYGSSYETSAAAALTVGIYCTSDAIMVAESIPMTTKVWWDDKTLNWFVDAFMAVGAAPDRTDNVALLTKVSA